MGRGAYDVTVDDHGVVAQHKINKMAQDIQNEAAAKAAKEASAAARKKAQQQKRTVNQKIKRQEAAAEKKAAKASSSKSKKGKEPVRDPEPYDDMQDGEYETDDTVITMTQPIYNQQHANQQRQPSTPELFDEFCQYMEGSGNGFSN